MTIWIIEPVLNYGDHGKANNAIADAWAHSNYLLKQSEVIIQETENSGYNDLAKCHLFVPSRWYETSLKSYPDYASNLIQLVKSTAKHYNTLLNSSHTLTIVDVGHLLKWYLFFQIIIWIKVHYKTSSFFFLPNLCF